MWQVSAKQGQKHMMGIHSSQLDTLLPVCPKERIPHVHRDVKTLFSTLNKHFQMGSAQTVFDTVG